MNRTFWHQTVTTNQIENYITKESKIDFSSVFDQYLRDYRIPTFTYSIKNNALSYQWTTAIPSFTMPIKVRIDGKEYQLNPTTKEQKLAVTASEGKLEVDRNYYVKTLKN